MNDFIVLNEDFDGRAAEIIRDIIEACEGRGCLLGLSGGNTPRPVYERLNRYDLDWERMVFVQVDERWVERDHPRSNARMIEESLSGRTFFAVDTSAEEPRTAAEDYEALIDEFLQKLDKESLDLVVLGMGTDGHTASIFPDIEDLGEYIVRIEDRKVVSHFVPSQDEYRVTLTPSFIRRAKVAVVLLKGKEKGETLSRALDSGDEERYPILQCLPPQTLWVLDREAYNALKWT